MKVFWSFLLTLFSALSVYAYPKDYEGIRSHQKGVGYNDKQLLTWNVVPEAKAVAIIVHGLNNPPSIMGSIEKTISSRSIHTLRVTLRGHGGDGRELKTVKGSNWVEDIELAYHISRHRFPSLPIYFIGYSMGALAGLELLVKDTSISFKKMVLFAPAITTHFYTHLIKTLFWFPQLKLFSQNIEKYRAHKSIPVQTYKALFQLIGAASSWTSKEWRRLERETLVVIHPEDELVSYSGIKSLCKKFNIKKWNFYEVDNHGAKGPGDRPHLMLNSTLLPRYEWEKMKARLLSFLTIF